MNENGQTEDDAGSPQVLDYRTPDTGQAESQVVVATFGDDFEANLAAERLRSLGIRCSLDNENTSVMLGSIRSLSACNIRLSVGASEAEAAQQALPAHLSPHPVRCPKCGSTNTVQRHWPTWACAVNVLLCGVPSAFIEPVCDCRDCGQSFRLTSEVMEQSARNEEDAPGDEADGGSEPAEEADSDEQTDAPA